MLIFLLVTTAYSAVLIGLRPAPISLRSAPLTIVQNIAKIKTTLLIGILLCGIHLSTTGFTFSSIKPAWLDILGIDNVTLFQWNWYPSIITNTFVHHSFFHLLTNLVGFAVLSLYERRVGVQRYLMVFVVSALASTLSVFAYSEPIIVAGVSGVVFGLAAAYFTDHQDLTRKDWFCALAAFVFLAIYVEADSALKIGKSNPKIVIDHFGHALGAVGAIVYCRLVPLAKS